MSDDAILWYVSENSPYQGAKSIRACSPVLEASISKPKQLYRKYRGLGVFEWQDVFNLAGQDLTKDLVAIRFGWTEQFKKPVPYDVAREFVRLNFVGPEQIDEGSFAALYRLGMGEDGI